MPLREVRASCARRTRRPARAGRPAPRAAGEPARADPGGGGVVATTAVTRPAAIEVDARGTRDDGGGGRRRRRAGRRAGLVRRGHGRAATLPPPGRPGAARRPLRRALFETGSGRPLVYVPAPTLHPPGRSTGLVPAAELATTHHGPHDASTSPTPLGTYVSEPALAVAGPVREIYHVGPRDFDDPSGWRTEIGWPVFRLGVV